MPNVVCCSKGVQANPLSHMFGQIRSPIASLHSRRQKDSASLTKRIPALGSASPETCLVRVWGKAFRVKKRFAQVHPGEYKGCLETPAAPLVAKVTTITT